LNNTKRLDMTYADILRPSEKKQALLYDVLLVAGGTLFIALLSQIKIPLPFSPVPITGQTFGVLLAGALLGRIRGAVTILVYLGEGLAGLPVFAGGGAGILHLFGPTGGYLVGFIGAAYTVGFLTEKGWDRKIGTTVLAMTFGSLIIFVVGLSWLAIYSGTNRLLAIGLFPFIPGDIIKIVLAAILLPSGWKLIGRNSG